MGGLPQSQRVRQPDQQHRQRRGSAVRRERDRVRRPGRIACGGRRIFGFVGGLRRPVRDRRGQARHRRHAWPGHRRVPADLCAGHRTDARRTARPGDGSRVGRHRGGHGVERDLHQPPELHQEGHPRLQRFAGAHGASGEYSEPALGAVAAAVDPAPLALGGGDYMAYWTSFKDGIKDINTELETAENAITKGCHRMLADYHAYPDNYSIAQGAARDSRAPRTTRAHSCSRKSTSTTPRCG